MKNIEKSIEDKINKSISKSMSSLKVEEDKSNLLNEEITLNVSKFGSQ